MTLKQSNKFIHELLTRRVDTIYPSTAAFKKKLLSGKKLTVFQGFDPTGGKLHLGHTVGIRKLMEFAELGHDVIFLFGGGTVLVGDPSEREIGRRLITEKEIDKNLSGWIDQVKPLVNFKKVRTLNNKEWLTKLTLKDMINIGSKISAVQLFKRDNFTKRIKHGDTVWYHETMYPLLQGYDSVHMNVDLEIGGTDQMFNMLIGRELVKKFKNKEKFVLTTKMILGLDGKTMSKTSGNCIWLTDSHHEMYTKLMTIEDRLIGEYYEFFTSLPMDIVKTIRVGIKNGKLDPMKYKKQLALMITADFHTESKAITAQAEFERVVQKGMAPSHLPVFYISRLTTNPVASSVDLLVQTKLVASRAQAKRLITQGGATLNNQKLSLKSAIKLKPGDIIKAGKKKWLKIK